MSQVNTSKPSLNTLPPIKASSISWPEINTQALLQNAAEMQLSGGRVYPDQGKKIGEILKSINVIDDQIINAVEKRHHTKTLKDKPTGELLVYMKIIEPEVLTRALCIQSGVLMLDLNSIQIPFNVTRLITHNIAHDKHAVPVGVYGGTLYLAVTDPLNFTDHHFFTFTTGLKITPVFAHSQQISACLHTH